MTSSSAEVPVTVVDLWTLDAGSVLLLTARVGRAVVMLVRFPDRAGWSPRVLVLGPAERTAVVDLADRPPRSLVRVRERRLAERLVAALDAELASGRDPVAG